MSEMVSEEKVYSREDINVEIAKIEAGLPFYQMLRESKRTGWPAAYVKDLLVHDRDVLAKRPINEPFVWILRECGTHIFRPLNAESRAIVQRKLMDLPRNSWFTWPSNLDFLVNFEKTITRANFYVWDGERFHGCASGEDALHAVRKFMPDVEAFEVT